MQAGSDGRTACATCHYNAGADNRSRNQINPRGGSFTLKGPNAQLSASDFPFHKLADPNDRASAVLSDTDNVSGSQGVLPSAFTGINEGDSEDGQTFASTDGDFHVGGTNVRRSTGRNTPSAINAVFNFRNFWDGRAQNDFNGVNPFGARDTGARVGKVNASGGVDEVAVSVTNASLASQSVGPPGNPVEMSADGRTLSDIGRKLLSLKPLGTQTVSQSDSVLGGDADASGRGLSTSYSALIQQAFKPDWWNSGTSVTAPNGRTYSLMQFNFPLFWGLAIQAYESTLVSDQTPLDRFLEGDVTALSADAQAGMSIFTGKGKCATCHDGPAMTSATAANIAATGVTTTDGGRAVDTGFANIGVRPSGSDPGNAGLDPFGVSLSEARRAGSTADAVGGSFKVPGLRNVALTAPYFHNGGELTLRQVVDFYSRGGDFANAETSRDVTNLGLSDTEKNQLVAFLEALTDPRVRDQSAPFDHPELFVPAGEQTAADGSVLTDSSGRAVDCFLQIGATGAAGGAPLAPFPSFTGPPCATPPALATHGGPGPSPGPGPGPVASGAASIPSVAGLASGARKLQGAVVRSTRCVVPRLRGRTLTGARRLLRRAHCRLGNVIRPAARGGRLRIRTQRPRAGTRRPANARVTVILRRLPARRRH
jgi:cytochrome c peroxidase